MRCKVCGHDVLDQTEYRTQSIKAPALECAKCRAIHLDERAATSEKDLDSVRRALAARQSVGSYDSATHRTGAGSMSPPEVDAVLREIDLVLAETRMVVDFLEQRAEGEIAKAVGDVRHSLQRIEGLVADLGRRCVRATTREEDDVPERAIPKKGGRGHD